MTDSEFDSFDRALLTELRQVAAEPAAAPVRRTRKRWAYVGTGVAAAAVTAFGLTSLGSPAAYAVDETGDGDIVITIHELDDADGLEQALADHGIEADVDYQSDGFGPGIGIEAPDVPDGAELDEGEVFKGHAEAELEERRRGRPGRPRRASGERPVRRLRQHAVHHRSHQRRLRDHDPRRLCPAGERRGPADHDVR